MNGSISVQRNRKPEGERYYPEDLIPFVAFGAQARFMNDYVKRGDAVVVQGSLEVNMSEDQNGQRRTYYSVVVDSVRGVPRSANDSSAESNNNTQNDTRVRNNSRSSGGGFPISDEDFSGSPSRGSEDYKPFG